MKNPYKNGPLLDIEYTEKNFFLIQHGTEFVVHNGKYTFSKASSIRMYNKLRDEAYYTYDTGSTKDKKKALEILATLKVVPFRMH